MAGLAIVVALALPAGAQTPLDPTKPADAKPDLMKLDKISLGANALAGARQGGFFQAVADGTYANYGLDVTIVPGGPTIDNRAMLVSGKMDFALAANTQQAFDAVANNIPVVTVAAMFQRDPQVLLAHPTSKAGRLEDLRSLTLFVSKEGLAGYFRWLKADYGFSEGKVKPYTSNLQPFLFDKKSAMEGSVTSEPFLIEQQGVKPIVLLLADYGFSAYSCLIETRRDLVDKKPDLVQRFVDASIVGWYNYLYGDNKPGNEMIRKLNPDMTDERLAYAVAKLKESGIVDSGDAVRDGIGAITDERIANFFDKMSHAGAVRRDLDFRKAYTLRFVNKGVGLDLRPRKMPEPR